MIGADTRASSSQPAAPASLAAAGLTLDLVTQLVLKTLYLAGELTGVELSRRLGVLFGVLEPSLEFLKSQRHCEVVGGAMLGGASFRYRISDAGRSSAALYLQQNAYIGTAPVPLEQYQRYMRAFGQMGQQMVTREQVRKAYAHMVLSDAVLDEIGPAINARHSLFVYGPPGNGKTSIAHAIRSLVSGEIAIPYALEVEGHIIRIFDPVTHERIADEQDDRGLELDTSDDRRWTRCRRPMVTVGGELSLESLDLNFEPRLGFYRAPVQLLANGGVLLIDDFGRQHCSPRELLNRWLVPLESRVDYLTLQSGWKFEAPFLVFVVFATNIKPADLVDEAFLRRVQYKVFAESPSEEAFIRIFETCCVERAIPFDRGLVSWLLEHVYRPRQLQTRACQPRDLINQALLLAGYLGRERLLTPELLEAACASYFVEDRE